MVLVDGLFIANEGGGPNLLRYLIDTIRSRGQQGAFFLLLDERFRHNMEGFRHKHLKASLLGRRQFYQDNASNFTKVFCFANTPPPIRLHLPVRTYFHNQMLLESRRHITNMRYVRFLLRYAFVAWWNRNTDEYIVQTPHMVDEIVSLGLKPKNKCREFPFFRINDRLSAMTGERDREFVYVSSASFYKNHVRLLNAWEYLFEKGLKPALHLTVTAADEAVLDHINRLQAKGVNITNHGYTNTDLLYSRCAYMVYPSLNESFGLSLIEGAKAGMKVLAADLPYVRSVIQASAYFDPASVESIAGVVEEAMKTELPPSETIVSDQVNALIDYILN